MDMFIHKMTSMKVFTVTDFFTMYSNQFHLFLGLSGIHLLF